ncbi:hypothetical protein UFOVP908_153 [uncultured Caudovirales phage]|uniref:Uncharacterized protein n=1 Tax=uncultured Caudovirales phage TaxID=2100421 RepID=A0A6J5Q749_9CAUD|nr:hypothetical protein UFOVP908_153 [uncultured Caudovirales phage]CAB4177165.1 hypothetical protein UFOVP990_216 [uncultured Caudovirales phage]CAB4181208.1 hypothetical protein UFOVP1065_14 [uncultured Caudovirales phage]CAB4190876.1 hypothetical protein UFOVP1198_216 [uncultured Caudovirales phage]CAB4211227.1 hypothetical protein UFOVP1418_208 [uncultured Caudovirales phage]
MSTAKVINIVHPSGTITNLVNDANGGIVIGGTLTANANVTVNGTSTFTGTLTAGNINITGNVTGNLTIAGTVTAANSNVTGTVVMSSSFKRNRIINGNMVIDQRNAGANVTPTDAQYLTDRFVAGLTAASKFTAQQSSTAPTGFSNSLLITSSSAYSVSASDAFTVGQKIEGFNFADLMWGTASAATVTLSFWVRSSLTGTFGGAITNSGDTRSYPLSYTISTANTWEQKSVTIAGDTSGTWIGSTNGIGARVWFGLGVGTTYSGTAGAWVGSAKVSVTGAVSVVGTNGATFYITGVQLEVGTKATPYEMQIYSDQLAQCQRYFQVFNTFDIEGYASIGNVRAVNAPMTFPVQMRAAPTRTVTTAGTLVNVRSSSTAYAGLGLCKLTSTQASASVEAAAAGLVQCTNQSETMSAEL